MPRPLYIIAAESYAEDKATNILSLFQILERVLFESPDQPPTPGPGGEMTVHVPRGFPIVILAAWRKEPGDIDGQTYEHEMAIIRPDGTEQHVHQYPNASFPAGTKKLARFALRIGEFIPTIPGTYLFESRLRPCGSSDWLRQSFPLDCELIQPPQA